MKQKEMQELVRQIAETTTKMVITQLRSMRDLSESEMVDTREAARILGVSPAYLRQIKDKFPHKKSGSTQQGRVLFRREDLIKSVSV